MGDCLVSVYQASIFSTCSFDPLFKLTNIIEPWKDIIFLSEEQRQQERKSSRRDPYH